MLIIVLDSDLTMETHSTKTAAALLKTLGVTGKTLVVLPETNLTIYKSFRNIPGITVRVAPAFSVRDVLDAEPDRDDPGRAGQAGCRLRQSGTPPKCRGGDSINHERNSQKAPIKSSFGPSSLKRAWTAAADNQYTFVVARNANKYEIAEAIERIQADAKNIINVVSVNTMVVKGKTRQGRFFKRSNKGRTSDWKKAIVTLQPGQSIELVEGV